MLGLIAGWIWLAGPGCASNGPGSEWLGSAVPPTFPLYNEAKMQLMGNRLIKATAVHQASYQSVFDRCTAGSLRASFVKYHPYRGRMVRGAAAAQQPAVVHGRRHAVCRGSTYCRCCRGAERAHGKDD